MYWKAGKGLWVPVAGSGSEMTLGAKRERRGLLVDLCFFLCSLCCVVSGHGGGQSDAPDLHTQLRLKQSLLQKKLVIPCFWQVGHCSVPASLLQSPPSHTRLSSLAILICAQSFCCLLVSSCCSRGFESRRVEVILICRLCRSARVPLHFFARALSDKHETSAGAAVPCSVPAAGPCAFAAFR